MGVDPVFDIVPLTLHSRAHGVVVSHPLRMRKALGSNPSGSSLPEFAPAGVEVSSWLERTHNSGKSGGNRKIVN